MIYATTFSLVSYNSRLGPIKEIEPPMPPDDVEDWELVTSVYAEHDASTYILHTWKHDASTYLLHTWRAK